MDTPVATLTVEDARRVVKRDEELIKLHTIHILLGCPPLPESLKPTWHAEQKEKTT